MLHSANLFPGFPRSKELRASATEMVALPPPVTQAPWRISIYVSNDVGPAWPIKRLLNAALPRLGLPAPYGVATCQIDSGRIEGQR